MTNSDEAISDVLNEYDARYPIVTQTETAHQYSASNHHNKSRQLNPNSDSLMNLNVDDNVAMKGWPEVIP